jgi:hypothetical protein
LSRHCERKRGNPFHGSAEAKLDCFVAIAPRNDEFDSKIARRANHQKPVEPLLQKYFTSRSTQISSLIRAVLPTEGRAHVTNAERDAVDAAASGEQ